MKATGNMTLLRLSSERRRHKKQDHGKWPNIKTTEIFEAVNKSVLGTGDSVLNAKGPVGENED